MLRFVIKQHFETVKSLTRPASAASAGSGASADWDVGLYYEVFPERVPVVVDVVSLQLGDGRGSGGRPIHAGPFQADSDQWFSRGLDHS